MKHGVTVIRTRQRGNAMVEFALVSVFLLTLLLGSFSVGMSLTRKVQAGIVSRDAGSMFMRYVDFNLAANRDIVVRLANGMGMTASGGNGVVILTQLMQIGAAECAVGGLAPASCPNFNQTVVIKRVTVGNTGIYTTTFGNPSPAVVEADGSITPLNYLNNVSCRAPNFSATLSLNAGEFAFVSEAYFRTPEIDMPGFRNNTHVYSRNIF